MSDGVLTRALADLARAGIPLAAALDPARREDCLRAPGIGLKAYDRLQEAAAIAAELQAKPKRGGAGRGQGRKPIKQGEDTVTVSLRLTTSQRAKLARLGGAAWVRNRIEKENKVENLNAWILDEDLLPLFGKDFIIVDDDFSKVIAAAKSANCPCCIRWTRESDGQAAYYGPRGCSMLPHWYARRRESGLRIEVAVAACVPSRDWLRVATKKAVAAASEKGIEWIDADVFVSLPEQGRCLTKSPGRSALCAHG